MTTINTQSLSVYSSVFPAGVKMKTETGAESSEGTKGAMTVDLRGNVYNTGGADGKADAAAPSTPAEAAIQQLHKQIKETQQQLLRQQQQLAAAQNSKAPDEQKAQQVMAIQQQIAGTMAQLMSQQAALMTLLKGTVSTSA